MVSEERIRAELKNVLEGTAFSALGELERGKVRDSYKQEGRRILVTSDRISAFDCVLGTIPFKGQVLNQLEKRFSFSQPMIPVVPSGAGWAILGVHCCAIFTSPGRERQFCCCTSS